MNKYLFIGIIAVLVVIIAGFFAFGPHLTEDIKIDILGTGEIEEGGSIHIKLTDKDGNPLKDKTVNVTILDKKGNSLSQVPVKTLKTDSNGKISYSNENLTKGKYIINVTFGGDDKYSANETTKKIKVVEKTTVETTPKESTQTEEVQTSDDSNDNHYESSYEEHPDGNGGTIHQFNWNGMTEYDFDDGFYIYEYDDGHVESGYYPGHGDNV